ncbi:hypothetical protein H5410_047837, partial [Solanum commersonii]
FTSSDVQSFSDILYFLNLKSVSVGGKKLEFKSSHLMNSSDTDEDSRNIIIYSGMILTFLLEEIYSKLESTLLEMIKGPSNELSICYDTKSIVDFPKIVFHFTVADIQLLYMNTFSKVDEDMTCLTIVSGGGGLYMVFMETSNG